MQSQRQIRPTQPTVVVALVVCAAQAVTTGRPDSTEWQQLELRSAVPTHLVLLYDNSSSQAGIFFAPAGPAKVMQGRTTTATRDKVVAALARGLPTEVRLRVGSFGHRVLISASWVRTAVDIERAFEAVQQTVGAPSPIWDGVWHAAETLESVSGRKVVVLITDGRASANFRGFEEAAERVAKGGIQVHGVATIDPKIAARIDSDADPSASLQELAVRTGGSVAHKNSSELPDYVGRLVRNFGR